MWHIVAIGYLFVAVMYSAAQPSIARALIYLVFWAVLPTVFTVFVVTVRRRNRLDEATGTGRIRTAACTTAKRQRHKTLNPFSDGLLSAIIRQFSISETLFYFLKLMPTFAEGCLTIGVAYQVLCD